ncbi:MAG: hypothetical protein WAQ22_01405 [Candidatus Saccharimonas sp.]
MPERSHNKEVKATPASIAHYYPPKRGGEAVAKRQPIDEGGRSDTDIDRQVAEQQKADRAKAYWDMAESISDLATVDGVGGVHIPAGSGRKSGRYMKGAHIELIAAHQDQIREGIKELSDMNNDVYPQLDPEAVARQFSGQSVEDALSIYPQLDPEKEARRFSGKDEGDNDVYPQLDPEAVARQFSGQSVEDALSIYPQLDPEKEARRFSGKGATKDDESKKDSRDELLGPREILEEKRNDFAKFVAKDRTSYFGRFMKGDGLMAKLARRIPGVTAVVDALNKRLSSKELSEAQEQYEEQLDLVLTQVMSRVERHDADNVSLDVLLAAKKAEFINEDCLLERKIAQELEARSKTAGTLTRWWMSQNGKKFGRLKKAAAVAGGAFFTAAVATVFLPGTIAGVSTGAIVGGLTGGSIAHQIHRRHHRAEVGRREDGAAITWAEQQAETHRASLEDSLRNVSDAKDIHAGVITNAVEKDTEKEKQAERRRLKISAGIGASAGGLAGVTVGKIHSIIENSRHIDTPASTPASTHNPVMDNNSGANSLYTMRPNVDTVKDVGEQILTGHVNTGDGFTQVLQQQFNNLSPEQLYQMHKDAVKAFGDHYITGVDTYTMPDGNLGFSGTGNAQFVKGFEDFANQWVATHS